jgi:hypothetical protein
MEIFLHLPFLAHLNIVMLNELRTEATLSAIVSQHIPLEADRHIRQDVQFTCADSKDISQV